jgi:hypothetical protein
VGRRSVGPVLAPMKWGARRLGDWGTWRWGERTVEFCEEGGFAGAGVAGEDEDVRRAVGGGEGEHVAHQRLAAAKDEAIGTLLDECFHLLRFLGEFLRLCGAVGREARGQFGIVFQAPEQIVMDLVAEGFESREPLLLRVPLRIVKNPRAVARQ